MNCPLCSAELEAIYYENIKQSGLACPACDLRLGTYDKLEEAQKARDLIAIAIEKED